MRSPRFAGVLLHPTSLPGPGNIGNLGPAVEPFLDWVQAAGLSVWQVLPLGPPAAGDSPYSSLSAFAGNPLLISAEGLIEAGLLERGEVESSTSASRGAGRAARVDFVGAAARSNRLLRLAWRRFPTSAKHPVRIALTEFCERERGWLDSWALFAVLRNRHHNRGWWTWEPELARREPQALGRIARALAEELDFESFVQFIFEQQWQAARAAAHARGIRVLGDVPIYVARDSADVWANRELFDLDEKLEPRAVAGVPPDYFSADGQLWGNPLYRWEELAASGYQWWIDRLRRNLALADLVRLDHFRGFAGYWRVPASAKTAREGAWAPGPGKALFAALEQALAPAAGSLPLIAEDLGEISADVHELRQAVGIPCMRVLQFGFDEVDGDHAPHRIAEDTLLFTGTHDNNTTAGWWRDSSPEVQARYREYTGLPGRDLPRELWRLALTSPARWAMAPMQDLLGLGSRARLNRPGVAEGNWAWRLGEMPKPELAGEIRRLVELSGRVG